MNNQQPDNHTKGLPFALLKPVRSLPRNPLAFYGVDTPLPPWKTILKLHPTLAGGVVAFDFETTGTATWDQTNCRIVGLGLAWEAGSIYLNLADVDTGRKKSILRGLAALPGALLAHNILFDGTLLSRTLGLDGWPWQRSWCTYALAKHLATEGWLSQQWGLKVLMVDLLGWPASNEKDLDDWLVHNGHHVGTSTDTGYRDEAGKKVKPDKSKMWMAPPHILGHYCALDAEATYQLWAKVFKPALDGPVGPTYPIYYQSMRVLQRTLIEAALHGITIDKPRLANYWCDLTLSLDGMKETFETHPEVVPHLRAYEDRILGSYLAKEPARLSKDGDVGKNWKHWQEKVSLFKKEPSHFNMGSAKDLRWLFFERMGHTPVKETEGGEPSVDESSLQQFGEPGKLLVDYHTAVKELTAFVTPYLEEHVGRDGKLRAGWSCPGTLTGRLSGKSPNLQQIPRSREFLSCLVPSPGTVWVDSDVAALEQVVLAELSKDPSLWKLYGPGAPANDVYLFTGSLLPGIGDKIRQYYDPHNPTPEGIAAAKKYCKHERGIAKTLVLSSSYGAGVKKIHNTLGLQGVNLSLDTVESLHAAYWATYAGVVEYRKKLEREWQMRGGWVRNGLGRPLGIHEDYQKDCVNRCLVGSTLVRVYDQGWKRLDMCTAQDYIWDGIEWVICEGLIQQGKRSVINLSGIGLTNDHRVWTSTGWKEAGDTRMAEILYASTPDTTWGDVWGLCNHVAREVAKKWKNICGRSMSSWRGQASSGQSQKRKSVGV